MKARKHEIQFSQHKGTVQMDSLTVNYDHKCIHKKVTESEKFQKF